MIGRCNDYIALSDGASIHSEAFTHAVKECETVARFQVVQTANGKIYFTSQQGKVAVVAAGESIEVLARNEFKEPIFATPAIVDGVIYLRTDKHLFAFGN